MSVKFKEHRTAESVSPKHPDKLCDRVSDAILDAYLTGDPSSRVAVDVAGGHGQLFITGEVTSKGTADIPKIVQRIVGDVNLTENICAQSPEIASGVDSGGAGDQGIMIGYACRETPELLPLEVALARSLNQYLYERWPYDGKTQVTISAGQIISIVASFQHAKKSELISVVQEWIKDSTSIYGRQLVGGGDRGPIIYANPAGDWQVGGFDADAGLTGRKLAVDNYGPRIPIGGGAFSGKDATKVDRSAAYMARRIAVDYLRSFQAREVLVRLAYAIGEAQPLEATAIVDSRPIKVVEYDLTPRAIIAALDLTQPIFERTAEYGHFGHNNYWER